jgi:hypothetical protein
LTPSTNVTLRSKGSIYKIMRQPRSGVEKGGNEKHIHVRNLYLSLIKMLNSDRFRKSNIM